MMALFRITDLGRLTLLGFVLLIGSIELVSASVISNIQGTKHNLSASPTPVRGVKAVSETQVCIFCHTAHASNQAINAPLWNRQLSTATYTVYTSSSMDATATQPTGDSKLCLSCHDGTLAVGTVGVLNSQMPGVAAMSGTAGGMMPVGAGVTTGYTRNIGINLSNDHPISFPYDTALAASDGELRPPPVTAGDIKIVDNRTTAIRPQFPLQNNQLQCTTCHDPHLQETDPDSSALKFLRGNRVQNSQPLGGNFVPGADIMCLGCHEKAGTLWAYSAHAHESVADETYLDAAATTREFAKDLPVWKASCLNCHDTHSVEGSRRLQREGTSAIDSPKSGGASASEQTCYQCHSVAGTSALNSIIPIALTLNKTPDIKTDAELTFHMPISLQPEKHDIGGTTDDSITGGENCNVAGAQCGKDFVESQALLGKVTAGGALENRHAECTDCHNPHRATKNRLFTTSPITPDDAGTHKHSIIAGNTLPHDNLASGALRGTYGVEPTYSSNQFNSAPSGFIVKRGDPALNSSTVVTSDYVTREYQVCLKCHSNYAFDNISPPLLPLVTLTGGTVTTTNGVVSYSDVAMESQAPTSHQGEPISTADSGASSTFSANNHRSWHPVMAETGRTAAARPNADANLWRTPWNGSDVDGGAAIVANAVGTQTMYCSDCHGSETALTEGVLPTGGDIDGTWGPHGSTKEFILKGAWDTAVPHTISSDNLCFRCHDKSQYADPSAIPASTLSSAFSDTVGGFNNLHQRHAYLTSATAATPTWPATEYDTYRCTMCHTGTAHGWKNKAFLANLSDLGVGEVVGALGGEVSPAGTLNPGDPVSVGTSAAALVDSTFPAGYSNGPYYRGTLLSIPTATGFPVGGAWVKTSCAGCH